jgi:chromosome segregation ATPase
MHATCSDDKLPLESSDLQSHYIAASTNALNAYKQRAVGVSAKQVQESLQLDIEDSWVNFQQRNAEASTRLSNDILSKLFDSLIREKMITDESNGYSDTFYAYNLNVFRNDWNQLFKSFYEESRGPSKHQVLAEFTKLKTEDCIEVMLHGMKMKFEEEINTARGEIQELALKLSSKEGECSVINDSLSKTRENLQSLESEKRDLSAKCTTQSKTIEELTVLKRQAERSAEEESDVRKRVEEKNKGLSKRVDELVGKEAEVFELRLTRDKQELQIQALNDEMKDLHQQIADMKSRKCVIS